MAYEKWIVKEGDEYIEHEENDGPSFLRHGPQASKKVLTDTQTIQYLEEKIKHNVPLLHELEKIALKLSFTADNLTSTSELIQRLAGEISGIQEKIKKE